MLILCGGCALAGAAALSGPTPRTAANAAASAASGRRLQQTTSEPCSGTGAQLDGKSGSLDFFDGHADGDVCSWTIACPPSGGTPVLVFSEFDTEAGYDWVDVFDGVPTCRDDDAGISAHAGQQLTCAHLSSSGQCPLVISSGYLHFCSCSCGDEPRPRARAGAPWAGTI
jgi:hypothetical protein